MIKNVVSKLVICVISQTHDYKITWLKTFYFLQFFDFHLRESFSEGIVDFVIARTEAWDLRWADGAQNLKKGVGNIIIRCDLWRLIHQNCFILKSIDSFLIYTNILNRGFSSISKLSSNSNKSKAYIEINFGVFHGLHGPKHFDP